MTNEKDEPEKIEVEEKDAKVSEERPRDSLYREPNSKGSSESHGTNTSHCPDNWGDG
ncbi:MAG: hypothetical protein OEZ58_08770 [Gammaproteobacteria bacterium]|nr:hypothetical protein [Gammaproteobacteria bacterium]MDH5729070.1 hypothetical protein [Gammaproteobacteria bacterium]